MLPILTDYLSPEDYGILSLLNTYVLILVPFLGLSATGLASVEYFSMGKNHSEFPSLFSSTYLLPIAGFTILTIIFYLFSTRLSAWLEIPWGWVLVLPLIALLTIYSEHLNSFIVLQKKTKLYSIVSIIKILSEISLIVFFVISLQWNWQGRMYAAIILAAGMTLYGSYYFYKIGFLRLNIKKHHLKAGILYGSPLIFHIIGKLVINQSDRIFIAKMVSLEETGLYSVGYQIGSIILIITSAFISIYTPFLYERLKEPTEKNKKEIIKLSYLFSIGLLLVLVLLYFATPLIFRLLNKNYIGGSEYVIWIGLGYWFWANYVLFAGYLYYLKKTNILAYFSIILVITNVIGNYLLINAFGALGAAYSTLISFIIAFMLISTYTQKNFPMPWFKISKIFER